MKKLSTFSRSVSGLYAALLSAILAVPQLAAQAPTDEWRRSIDAMVAEPAQVGSILSNPAGIKTNEDRAGKKHEWLFELMNASFFLTDDTVKLISEPESSAIAAFGFLQSLIDIANGRKSADQTTLELLQDLATPAYNQLVRGTTSLASKSPGNLTLADLTNMTDADAEKIQKNLQDVDGLASTLANSVLQKFTDGFGDVTVAMYSRALNLSHVNDKRPLAWGFYFGIEQKFFISNKVESVHMPISLEIEGIQFDLKLPIGLQIYATTPLRVAFAHNFAETLPGFTFGLGLKAVPYFGLNQTGLGNMISYTASTEVNLLGSLLAGGLFDDLTGLNLGIDLGLQYHFGAITPKLEFLHTGLKISDLVGVNIPFSNRADTLRYALDFDWGIFAEQKFLKIFQVFGGFEIIQMRGMFPGGGSPYSALFRPVDHLRFLIGLGFFDNRLRFALQYYNGTLTPSLQWNTNLLQLGFGMNLRPDSGSTWGIEFSINFRGPRDGFNAKTPYKTWAQRRAEKRQPIQATASTTEQTEAEAELEEKLETAEGAETTENQEATLPN